MEKKLVVFILTFALIVSSATLVFANVSSENLITGISVTGNSEVSDEEILERVSTEIGDSISNEQLQEDMHSIFDIGYFFDLQVLFQNHKGGVMLIFEVIENPILSDIEVVGNDHISDDVIRDLISLSPGELLNINELDKDTNAINEYYQEKGYALAKVVDITLVEDDKLKITIDEGRINNILLSGNEETRDYVIKRELSMEEGEPFNIDKMWRDLRRIHNLGFFEDVRPSFEPVKGDQQAIDLVIEVVEGKTGTFSVGGGYSSQSGLTGLINLEKDNFRGRGQNIKLNWQFGSKNTTYEVGFYEPWLFGHETSLGFNIYNKQTTEVDDTKTDTKGGDITIGRPITDDIKGYLRLNYDKTSEDGEEAENTRSLSFTTIRDTRDNIFNPREGGRQQFSIEKAGFGGDTNFNKYYADFRHYLPSRDNNSWAFRFKVGGSSGELNKHNHKRYTLGGLDEIRGYKSGDIEDAVSEGFRGDSILVANLEYRFDIVDNLMGVAFVDAGRTFEYNRPTRDKLSDLNYSAGIGARFNTPIGQLGLDYGFKEFGLRDGRFSFRIGNTF
ncbi:BamA/OMP85 family outer membrane protein [Halonatronum saccharophilum]|uniref:BamA/OMP85 family outer membrane protein n=1 Tax=Halonatronum saccharophilum TaxID=150060 RepID=UPI00047F0DE7|nr:BamA/TamA family outer membrane protein [Halonatronum saccharophilum]